MNEKITIDGLGEFRRDLDKLSPALEKSIEEIADDLRFVWKITGIQEGAYLTGAYVGAIRTERASAEEFLVGIANGDPVEKYASVIEEGRRDLPSYPARYVAEKSIVKYEVTGGVEKRIDEAFDRTLK